MVYKVKISIGSGSFDSVYLSMAYPGVDDDLDDMYGMFGHLD